MMSQPAVTARIAEPPAAEPVESLRLRLHSPRSLPPGDETEGGGSKVLAYLKYRWVTVLFLGGALASALSLAAWNLIPSKYTTTAMIRVYADNPVVYHNENPLSRSDFNTYLKTQADMLRSHYVLAAAIRDPGIAELPMLREQVDPIRYLEEELRVETKEGSEIIKVSLSGDDARSIAAIVNSIQSAFFREVVDDELKRKKARLVLLEDTMPSMQKDVKQRYTNLQNAETPQKPSEVTQAISAQLASGQVVRLKEMLFNAEADIKTYSARRDGLLARLNNLAAELPPMATLMETVDADPKVQAYSKQLEQHQNSLDYFITKLGADPNHPAVVDLRQKIGEAQEHREQHRKAKYSDLEKTQTQVVLKRLHLELEDVKAAISNLGARKEQTEKLIDEYQAVVANPAGPEERPVDFLRVDIKEREGIIKGMIDKANLLHLEVNAPARVRPFQTAAVPLKKEMKKQIMAAALAGLFGFALVGFGVVTYESRVRRALSLDDVQKATLGPVIGVVPGVGAPAEPAAPNEGIAEALDKTRCVLQQQFDRPGCKLILVGSALRDEGKSFLAWQLAASFAHAGTRTLLVDFDLRSPSMHGFAQVPNEAGFCETLAGADGAALIQTLPTGLHLMTAGQWSEGIRPLLVPERLGPMLGRLRDRFDCIIVNAHPVLAVAETSLAIRFADAVLLAVEKHESRLPLVARAQDKVANLAPDSFGVVFLGASADECLN